MLPILAIVGRPNVGKSTLFNRLAGRKLAIVDDQPGVTRDRKTADARLADMHFEIFDTAGYESVDNSSLEARMRVQTEQAVALADIILFVIDARDGVVIEDEVFATYLRKVNKPLILLANKCEGNKGQNGLLGAYSMGLGEPLGISAEHGEGMGELYQAIRTARDKLELNAQDEVGTDKHDMLLPDENGEEQYNVWLENDASNNAIELEVQALSEEHQDAWKNRPIRLAVVGRPNAGKSTLINALLNDDRLLTGPEAGITRDSVMVRWKWDGRDIHLVDTAGLRKRAKVQMHLEKLATSESVRTIRFADIVALVMDSREAFEKQDLQIADLVLREGRGLVLILTKWDLVENPSEVIKELRLRAQETLPLAGDAALVSLSALKGKRVEALMPAVIKTYEDWNARAKTRDLNDWLQYMVQRHPPPSVYGKRIKPRYLTQIKTRPPTFVMMCSRAEHMPQTYKRYIINGLRKAFDMPGIPIRLILRQGKNPYDQKDQ